MDDLKDGAGVFRENIFHCKSCEEGYDNRFG